MSGLVVDLLLAGQRVRTVSFDRPVLRIGRMRENDLALDDLAVSRFHARLHLDAGRVFLEDGGSENGSWINGRRVRGRVELAPGDRIAIGRHELRVRTRQLGEASLEDAPTAPPAALGAPAAAPSSHPPLPDPPQEPAPMPDAASLDALDDAALEAALEREDFDFSPAELAAPAEAAEALVSAEFTAAGEADAPSATVLLSEEDVAEDAPPSAPPVAPRAEAPPLHAGLIVQRDGRIERVVPWDGDVLTVGRSSECDLVLGQDEVSRRHARLVRSGDRYEVHDLGSVNGTMVNGRRAERHVLAVGDVIAIEGFQLTFVLDREPITSAMKPAPARPTQPVAGGGRDTFAMTILQEALPGGALDALDAPAAAFSPSPSHDATIANVTLEEELLATPEEGLEPSFGGALEERKELAAAQPRGSSRAASVQDLGPAAAPSTVVTLELLLRVDQLPEPLRRAFAEADAADLAIPAEVRLRS
jgi:pSer/pThr/pTyr-binding forkhead associated (FHA) protein